MQENQAQVAPPQQTPAPQESISIPQALWRGMVRGTDTFTRFLAEPILSAVEGKDQAAQHFNQDEADYQAAVKQHNIASYAGNFAGQTLGSIPILAATAAALPESAAAGATGLALRSALQGGILGAVQDPQTGTGSRLSDALIGAGSMGALGGALGVAGKGIAALTGAAKHAGQMLTASDETGIPVGLADLAFPGLAKILNGITKYIPFSGFGFLKNQQEQALEPGIKQFISNIAAGSDGSEQAIADAIANRASTIKSQAGQLFNDVSQQAKDLNLGPVPLTQVNKIIAGLDENTKQYAGIKSALSSFETPAEDSNPALANAIGKEVGYKLEPTYQDSIDFDQARQARTLIGNEIGRLQNNPNIPYSVLKNAHDLKDALTNDIDEWGTSSGHPELTEQYMHARSFYQSYANVFKNPMVARALADDTSMETMVKKLVTDNNSSRVQQIMNTLDNSSIKSPNDISLPEDQTQTARAFVLQDALQRSYIRTPDGPKINLNSFLSHVNQQGLNAQNVVWGDQMDKLNGLNSLLSSLAPKMTTEPQGFVGNAVDSMGQAAGALAAGAAIAKNPVAVSLIPVARLFNSPKMANLLTRWNFVNPNTPTSVLSSLKDQSAEAVRSVLGTEIPIALASDK